jgi:hypothetical protein
VLVLINMASVVSLSVYPGPAEITYGALHADVIWED